MQHSASKAEEDTSVLGEGDTVIYLDEIDIVDVHGEILKSTPTDPFLRVPKSYLPRKMKQKVARLEKNTTGELKKKLEGKDGAESKYVDPELVTGYSLFNVVTPPYDQDALALLYEESYIVHSVVDSRTMNTVGLGYSWNPTTKAQRQTQKAIGDEDKADSVRTSQQREIDKLTELFQNFNQEETLTESLIKVWTDVLTLGNGYLEIGRKPLQREDGTREIGYIGHIPGHLVRVRRPRDGFVQQANWKYVFFRNFGDTTTVDPVNGDPNPNEIIHFKLYTPTNSFYGVPPSVAALSSIVGDKFAKEFNIDYFENKAIPRYAIILKGVKLSNKSKSELINYFRNEVKGKNHGTLVIPLPASIGSNVQADVKFEKLETDVQEASFDKYRKANRDDVLVAYRIPPTKAAVFENANLAVSRDADKTFKTQVISPDQQVIESKINRLVREFSDLFVLEFTQYDLIDEDTESRVYDRYLRTQVMVPNEVRSKINLPALPGGDEPLPYNDPNLKYVSADLTQNERRDIEGFPKIEGGDKDPVEAAAEMAAAVAPPAPPGGGAPTGNKNSGSQPKSGEDSGKTTSDKNTVGTRAEKGELQDKGKGRDRSGG